MATSPSLGPSAWRRVLLALVATVGLLALAPVAKAVSLPTAETTRTWAPAEKATIHPGVQTDSDGAQCTANFIFTSGDDVLIGQAAHCTGTGAATETNGCLANSLPIGTKIGIEGASKPGVLVYNSWRTMLDRGEDRMEPCLYNDFALIRVDPVDHAKINPSVPYWGGPVALGTTTDAFEQVYSYGNSSLRFGIQMLSPKEGYSLGTTEEGWSHLVYTVTPGIPGDSGSAFLDSKGRAVGVLSTVAIAPLTGSNEVSDLSRAIAYARQHGGLGDLTLVAGTEKFVPGLLP